MGKAVRHRKVAVLGFRAVGKSCLTRRFVEGAFDGVEHYVPTIENTHHKRIKFHKAEFDTEIVDTAGQDDYTIFQTSYSIGVHGYVIVYSIASKQSFEMVKSINDKLLNVCGSDRVPRVLVGNKTDLDSERQILEEEGAQLAQEWGCAFVEASAKDNENVDIIFDRLMAEIQKEDGAAAPEGEKCVIL